MLSRQALDHIERTAEQIENIQRGAYVLLEGTADPEIIVIATGSEVKLAYNVCQRLNRQGRQIRLVSMPSTDVFDAQDQAYRDTVLPLTCRRRIAVEAGISDYWRKYTGLDGRVLGIDRFGESAPAADVYEYLGITEDSSHPGARI